MAGIINVFVATQQTVWGNWPPSKGKLEKNYSIYYADASKWFSTTTPQPDFPKRKSSLRQVNDWLIYPEDKVICSLVDGEFSFTRNKVRAEDAVFQIQSKFVEGVFHWKPMYKLHKGKKRIIGSAIAFQGTKGHLIFFLSA